MPRARVALFGCSSSAHVKEFVVTSPRWVLVIRRRVCRHRPGLFCTFDGSRVRIETQTNASYVAIRPEDVARPREEARKAPSFRPAFVEKDLTAQHSQHIAFSGKAPRPPDPRVTTRAAPVGVSRLVRIDPGFGWRDSRGGPGGSWAWPRAPPRSVGRSGSTHCTEATAWERRGRERRDADADDGDLRVPTSTHASATNRTARGC